MLEFLTKIRFLPVTIFAAGLMLSVKIGNIWEGVDGILNGTVSVAGAEAQQKTGAEPSPNAAAAGAVGAAAGAAAQDGAAEPMAEPPAGRQGGGTGGAGAPRDAVTQSLTTKDPTLLTQAEIDILQQLAERREELDARARELDMRAGMLDAAESRIDKKIGELKRFQARIEELIKKYDDQQDRKLDSLVKIYENMKPKDAARIFEQLDMNTLLTVAERMKERKLAAIMADMDRSRASEVTQELMRLRDLPEAGLQVR